ncbi:MAG: hypothetical protein EP330_20720 [Deltaproteobacteria bacterium]|nr:MAG: hypothetical protein EP330_20720 [Deltaproteobacteria bacterium]
MAAADAVAPFLELGLSARRDALAAGSLRGRHAALLFADAPLDQARRWLDMIEGAEVRAALARALADPDLRPLPDPIALPLDLPAWCFARVRADRPGRLADLGLAVGPEPAWVAVFEDRRLELAPVGVEGRWDLASTDVPGNILGARGVTMRFYASGRVDLLFADAFVGPLAALEIARQMGHSGMTSGTWQAVGPSRIRFGRFGAAPITMHQRDGSQAMPQVGFGVTEWVAALEGSEWRVERGESELVLDGRLMDMPVRLRLVPERD